MTDVLLVAPPYRGLVREPLGLYYLSDVLRRNGISAEAMDLNVLKMSREKFHEFVRKTNPRIVGLTSYTFNFSSAMRIVEEVKRVDRGVVVVLGGVHASFQWKEILGDSGLIDYIVVGEGELTLLELCQSILGGASTRDVEGIAYREGEIRATPPRGFIDDLGEIPIPDRGVLPQESYPIGVIQTSRGCPFTCIFCNICTFYKRRIRMREPEDVVEEASILIDRYKRETIFFFGDTFTLDSAWVDEFCEEITRRKLRFNWACETRIDNVNSHMLRRMRSAGCLEVQYGIEYGDEDVLARIGKRISLSNAVEAVKWAKDAGLFVESFFIFNCPGEDEDTMNRTYELIQKAPIDALEINLLTPYPGTALWENPEKYDMKVTNYDFDNYTTKKYVMENRSFPKRKFVPAFKKILKRLNLMPVPGYIPEIFNFLENEEKTQVFT
jgi:radical SAM superfamily enzyme YgiQ (UPF0313 family)